MLQYIYHNIKDMEFLGVFDLCYNDTGKYVVYLKYFLFIKFGDLVYVDIKGVGTIIVSFAELMSHRYLKMYYELSLVLTENKHKIIEKKKVDYRYIGEYNKEIYKEERDWFIDTAYFIEDFSTRVKRVETGKYYCYYSINPNDLRNMSVSSDKEIAKFYEVLYCRYGYEQVSIFDRLFADYINLMLEYNIGTIGAAVEEISVSQEDDKNFVNLLELNKKGMNGDIFRILYNAVISTKGQKKYDALITD
uniref:Uncharacterized protein n=1 Tax=viral metagenome TaxID=1070528 RepID=A0A6C0K5V2_9ZZZZ